MSKGKGCGKTLFFFMLIGAAVAVWFFGTTTFVKTDKETFRMKKPSFGLSQTYVDTRDWGLIDYLDNPHIAKELIARGYSDIKEKLKDSPLNDSVSEQMKKASEAVEEGIKKVSEILDK